MERKEFNKKIADLFPDYKLSETDCTTFLSKNYKPKEYKITTHNHSSVKATIQEIGEKYIYISSEMYPNESRNFWYCTFVINGLIRNFRCKNWNEIELEKQYFSGKTLDELYNKIVEFKNNKVLNSAY